jgi:hypothetical protein
MISLMLFHFNIKLHQNLLYYLSMLRRYIQDDDEVALDDDLFSNNDISWLASKSNAYAYHCATAQQAKAQRIVQCSYPDVLEYDDNLAVGCLATTLAGVLWFISLTATFV